MCKYMYICKPTTRMNSACNDTPKVQTYSELVALLYSVTWHLFISFMWGRGSTHTEVKGQSSPPTVWVPGMVIRLGGKHLASLNHLKGPGCFSNLEKKGRFSPYWPEENVLDGLVIMAILCPSWNCRSWNCKGEPLYLTAKLFLKIRYQIANIILKLFKLFQFRVQIKIVKYDFSSSMLHSKK